MKNKRQPYFYSEKTKREAARDPAPIEEILVKYKICEATLKSWCEQYGGPAVRKPREKTPPSPQIVTERVINWDHAAMSARKMTPISGGRVITLMEWQAEFRHRRSVAQQ